MQTIKSAFTCAAAGTAGTDRGFGIFWMMVFAIAILDDGERCEKERRKRDQAQRPPAGPKP